MRTTLILVLLSVSSGWSLAQNQSSAFVVSPFAAVTNAGSDYVTLPEPTPTRSILPEDIEQDSIQMLRFSTNGFVVRFTYTEAGAKKMLAFRREHAGHEVVIHVGSFERRYTIAPLEVKPAGWTEEGYLKHRGDKVFGVSEDEAKKIVDGLKQK
jgi:hypothetical protein